METQWGKEIFEKVLSKNKKVQIMMIQAVIIKALCKAEGK